MMSIGYSKLLYILTFDHRSSFEKGLFGWAGELNRKQTDKIAKSKEVIYDWFKLAVNQGILGRIEESSSTRSSASNC